MEEGKQRIAKAEKAELKHHSRRLSIKEGMFWGVRASCGDHYIAPFTIALGAPNALVAITSSLWNLGPASQYFGSKLIGKFKRKKIVTKSVGFETIGWLLMTLTAFAYYKNILTEFLPYSTIFSLMVIVISGGFAHPAWFSWMGDIIDARYRGRWFSKRSTIISFVTIIFAILASFLLDYFKDINQAAIGFLILFAIAFLARVYSVKILNRQYEPKEKTKKKKKYSLRQFFRETRNTNFGKFTLFRTMLAIMIGLTTPLTAIYLLKFLKFDYTTYIIISLSGTLFSIFFLNFWGKLADKYGNYKVISITTLLIPLTPILWILSSSKLYLFLIPAIIGGTTYTAFIVASGNFIYDNVKKEKIGKAISYFNLLVGLAAFLGGLIGAALIESIHTTWIEPIKLIFIIGTTLRIIIVAFWIPKLKEIKKKKELNSVKDFEKELFEDIKPVLTEDAHEIMGIAGYVKER